MTGPPQRARTRPAVPAPRGSRAAPRASAGDGEPGTAEVSRAKSGGCKGSCKVVSCGPRRCQSGADQVCGEEDAEFAPWVRNGIVAERGQLKTASSLLPGVQFWGDVEQQKGRRPSYIELPLL